MEGASKFAGGASRARVSAAALALVAASALAFAQAGAQESPIVGRVASSVATVLQAVQQGTEGALAGDTRETPGASSARPASFTPLSWDASTAHLVGRQGTTGLWGTCGECAIANTLNLACGSSLSEADVVGHVLERGLCDPTTGGMTLDDMADAYAELLPANMDVHGYGGDYAPSPDEVADLLDDGILVNASVYGAMMREGGHEGEGDVEGTHWIVVHEADRAADGTVTSFGIIDSASSITRLTRQEFADTYYGRNGTTITDPSCLEIYAR